MQILSWARIGKGKDQGINTSIKKDKLKVLKTLEEKQEEQDVKDKKLRTNWKRRNTSEEHRKVHQRNIVALEKYKCYIGNVIAEQCNDEVAMKNELVKQEVDRFTVDLSLWKSRRTKLRAFKKGSWLAD